MRSRGTWPFVQDWYSICSSHREHRDACKLCATGSWRYRVATWTGHLLYTVSPGLWRMWANRPAGRRRLLELMRKIRGEKHQ